MMISTKGRYALRVMVDLAQHEGDGYIPLKDIAQRQGLSEKYLESIVKLLARSGDLAGVRGKGGGYRLTRAPQEYSVGAILRLTEGNLSPVNCQALDGHCENAAACRTRPLWQKLDAMVEEYLDSVALSDLLEEPNGP